MSVVTGPADPSGWKKTTGGNDGTQDPIESRRCNDVFRFRSSHRHGNGLIVCRSTGSAPPDPLRGASPDDD